MPDYTALMKVLEELCNERNIRCCVTKSLKGGILAGVSTVIGGILLGPVGLAIGGAVGGVAAAATSKGKFESAGSIILRLPPKKQEQLYMKIKTALRSFDVQDVVVLCSLLLNNKSVSEIALNEVKKFLTYEMDAKFQ